MLRELKQVPIFEETMIRWIMRQVCEGIQHIHANGIVHRDLKPPNILIDAEKRCVKIIDFGLAKINSINHKSGLLIGTLDYIAPEIITTRGKPSAYAPPCDIWALGIMMFLLFSGKSLMKRNEQSETMDAICKQPVKFEDPLWTHISKEAKDLIQRMLDKNPKTRITAEEATTHPFFKELDEEAKKQAFMDSLL